MTMQQRAEARSLALHRAIVQKLRTDPSLWEIPARNIARWKRRSDGLTPATQEWEHILQTSSKEQGLALLESDSEEAVRLRSSSPFTGILSESERQSIFEAYRMQRAEDS